MALKSVFEKIQSNLEFGVPGQKMQFDNSYLRYCNPGLFDDSEGCPDKVLEFEEFEGVEFLSVDPYNFAKLEQSGWSGAWEDLDEQAIVPTAEIIHLDRYISDFERDRFFDNMYRVSAQEYEQSLYEIEDINLQCSQASAPRIGLRRFIQIKR